ncbi:MAG TPA: DUF1572 family protein [Ignavibacteriaceae bacterium]|nr:DUF1572 family protein [Ignavibacteriaceae bacterium]
MELGKSFLEESKYRLESSFIRIFHCLDQLNERQIWWKPDERMNSAGILIKHICGNLKQWTIIQMNGSEDHRKRDEEFKDEKKLSKAELINLLKGINKDFISAAENFNPARLSEPKSIQGYKVTIMTAVFRSMTHLEGHVGQIIMLTRLQLGEQYKIYSQAKAGELKAP